MIYLDNNATTRTLDCVLDAMRPFFTEQYANPASAIAHFAGIPRAIAAEKRRLAEALGAESGDQLVITSGATESNNLAILGAAKANPDRNHIIISAIEHPSVLEPAEALRRADYRISMAPVHGDGVIDQDSLDALLSPNTLLVSVMMANNETGVIQPIRSIAQAAKRRDSSILVHTDATQAVGKVSVNLADDLADVDLLSFSAHKFHGPKGVGSLFVRDPDIIAPIAYGGNQQGGLRPGTENAAAVVGMSTALTALLAQQTRIAAIGSLRDKIEAGMLAAHHGAFVLGASVPRLPNTAYVCLPDMDAEALVDHLAAQGIAISTGSACSRGARKPSHVALASGLSYEHALSCVRISLSIESTVQEVDTFLSAFAAALRNTPTHQTALAGGLC